MVNRFPPLVSVRTYTRTFGLKAPVITLFSFCYPLIGAALFLFFLFSLESPRPAQADIPPAEVVKSVGFEEKLGGQIDLDLPFLNDLGQQVKLREAMKENRPFILTPVYYSCPHLCTLTLNGVTNLLKELQLKLGEDYSLLSYTIKPSESVELAAKKKANYLKEIPDVVGRESWVFLTGAQESIESLSSQIGFKYQRDDQEYAHSAALLILTPDGRISKYRYGVVYDPSVVKLALVEASEGRIGNIGERIFLYCFRYDHVSGKYTPLVMNITRVVCTVFAFLILGGLAFMRIAEARESRRLGT